MNTTLLVDGHYMIHRILNVPNLQALKTKDGTPSGGIFGFLRALFATAKRAEIGNIERVIVAFDYGNSKRRKKIFPGYRERPPKEEETEAVDGDGDAMPYYELFHHQRKAIVKWVEAMGAHSLCFKKREADDIIAKIIELDPKRHYVVVSDDKDFLQLLGDNVHIFRPMAEEYVDPEHFKKKFGFKHSRYLLYKALIGDPSDMVPGVKGVGEKSAVIIASKCKGRKALCEIPEWSADKEYSRIRKGLNIAASKDAYKTVKRNLSLFDMSKEKFKDKEIKEMEKALSKTRKVDYGTLRELADTYELDSIAQNLGRWLSVFKAA